MKKEFIEKIPYFQIIFPKVKQNLSKWLIADYSSKEVTLKLTPNNIREDNSYIFNKAKESFKSFTNSSQLDKQLIFEYWNNIFSSILTSIIYDDIFTPIYNIKKQQFTEADKNTKKIIYKDFKSSIITIVEEDMDEKSIQLLYSLFVWSFGDTLTRQKISKITDTNSTKKNDFRLYNGEVSKKYQIQDYSSVIYRSVSIEKLKTLFNECKQLLLFEYNESRSSSRNQKVKTIQQAKVKEINTDDKTITLIGTVNNSGNSNQKDIQEYFHTNPFYMTVNKNKYYYIVPKEFDQSSKELKAIIDTNEPLDKEEIKVNSIVTYADTFGVKYDISAKPANKQKSVWEKSKLKQSLDIIGLTGDDNIFKTAAGETLTAIAGDIKQLIKIWIDKKDPEKELKVGTDNNIRYNILNMFKVYVVEILKNSGIKNKNVYESLPILANNLDKFNDYIKWIFEVVNYIMSEFYNENPNSDSKEDAKKYFIQRNFFKSSGLSSVTESIYNTIQYLLNEYVVDEFGDTGDNLPPKSDPKAVEIIKGINNQDVVDDVINYLMSIKTIK